VFHEIKADVRAKCSKDVKFEYALINYSKHCKGSGFFFAGSFLLPKVFALSYTKSLFLVKISFLQKRVVSHCTLNILGKCPKLNF